MNAALRNIELTAEPARIIAVQAQVSRAEGDYRRFRAAYLETARTEAGNELALAMFGSDMNRAHAHLQALAGLPNLRFTHEPSAVVLREAMSVPIQDQD